MDKIGGLIYLFLYVKDLQTSRDFYEKKLDLKVLEEDSTSVKYDAGGTILALNIAKDYGIAPRTKPDDTSIIVFHVDDIDVMRLSLEARDVSFSGETERYDIGATAIFYDPDGHCLCLYEPSDEAMTWESADKIRGILASSYAHSGNSDGSAQTPSLRHRNLIYLFLFVRDVDEAREFYSKKLGLKIVEESPEAGVTKYDAGGLILA
ncbi:MAG TPA: VOC family protein, partial [Pyrinomonadaceae bacterium]|nr:VOC family protein [Pyrinomonadaceae bacterium]